MVLFDGHKIFVWWGPFQLYLLLYDGCENCDMGLFWEYQEIVTTEQHILFGEIKNFEWVFSSFYLRFWG